VNLEFFGLILLAYFLGSIPTAVIVGRILGVDVRRTGSGNPGAANMARVTGRRSWGAFVLLIDALKGFLPARLGAVALAALGSFPAGLDAWTVRVILGAAAILGHVTSPVLGFRGGKGVATSLGVVLALAPIIGLVCFALWALMAELTRRISVSSLAAGLAFPALLHLAPNTHPAVQTFAWLVPLFLTFTHRKNLLRLVRGNEPAIPSERLVRNFLGKRNGRK